MAYPFADFNGPAATLKKDIDDAKLKNTYVGKERAWDQTILKSLAPTVQASMAITDDYHKKVGLNHAGAKKTFDEMESLVKKKGKSLSEGDLKVLRTSVRLIGAIDEQVRTINGDMFRALSEYRGGWPDTYRKLLSNPALLEPLKGARQKGIDEGKAVDTLKKRLAEYVVRAQDMLKQADQAVSKTSTLAGNAAAAAATFKTKTEAIKSQFDIFAGKATTSLQQIADLPPKTKIDPKLMPAQQSRINNGQAEAKNARGQQKTLEMKVETFAKLAAKLEGEEKKTAVTQITAATALVKAAAASEKTLAKLEEKAVKVWTAVSKLK